MKDDKLGFVALKSLKQGPPDPQAAFDEIRRIYFKTSKKTIEHDFVHAIELLKSLPEEEREKATVYMHGINEMHRQWISGKVEKVERLKSKSGSKPGSKSESKSKGKPEG